MKNPEVSQKPWGKNCELSCVLAFLLASQGGATLAWDSKLPEMGLASASSTQQTHKAHQAVSGDWVGNSKKKT